MKSGYKYLDTKHFVLFILQQIFHNHYRKKADYGRLRNELDTYHIQCVQHKVYQIAGG